MKTLRALIGHGLRTGALFNVLLVCLMLAVAYQEGRHATAGLRIPPDQDLFRDAALAQTIADGAWGADQYYEGERLWYNPLVPALVAVTHTLTGSPILTTYARSGAWLNLLGPITFFALVSRILGLAVGTAAIFALIFLPPTEIPSWSAASYGPWLFAGTFSQAIFYVGALFVDAAQRSLRLAVWCGCGVVLGVAFLGHTAPALLLGGILVVTAVRAAGGDGGQRRARAAGALALSLLTAFLVSLPLSLPILFHYKLRVLNPVPASYVYAPTSPANWLPLLHRFSDGLGILAGVGLALLVLDRDARVRARLFWTWMLVNALLLGSYYASPTLATMGYTWQLPMPAFHLVLYMAALRAVLMGYSIWWIVGRATALAVKRFPAHRVAWVSHAALAAVLLAGTTVLLPPLRDRKDFAEAPDDARELDNPAWATARQWIRASTQPGEVFATPPNLGLYIVGPAGGRVVWMQNVWASPYVDTNARKVDWEKMMDALARQDQGAFCALTEPYQVRYMMPTPAIGPLAYDVPPVPFLQLKYFDQGIGIWSVVGCAPVGG